MANNFQFCPPMADSFVSHGGHFWGTLLGYYEIFSPSTTCWRTETMFNVHPPSKTLMHMIILKNNDSWASMGAAALATMACATPPASAAHQLTGRNIREAARLPLHIQRIFFEHHRGWGHCRWLITSRVLRITPIVSITPLHPLSLPNVMTLHPSISWRQ